MMIHCEPGHLLKVVPERCRNARARGVYGPLLLVLSIQVIVGTLIFLVHHFYLFYLQPWSTANTWAICDPEPLEIYSSLFLSLRTCKANQLVIHTTEVVKTNMVKLWNT